MLIAVYEPRSFLDEALKGEGPGPPVRPNAWSSFAARTACGSGS